MALSFIPPYQINADPYFTQNTGNIMRMVMDAANNTSNRISNEQQYWRGTLPAAYEAAIRDQFNKVAQANLEAQQNARTTSSQNITSLSSALAATQDPTARAALQSMIDKEQQNAGKAAAGEGDIFRGIYENPIYGGKALMGNYLDYNRANPSTFAPPNFGDVFQRMFQSALGMYGNQNGH